MYSDGSVLGESVFGEGGCGVVLTQKGNASLEKKLSKKVGRRVDNVTCEIEGVLSALEMLVEQVRDDKGSGSCFFLTDCQSAVDVVVNQKECHQRIEVFRKVWSALRSIRELGAEVRVGWIPGHANLHFNDNADSLANVQYQTVMQLSQKFCPKVFVINSSKTKPRLSGLECGREVNLQIGQRIC